MLANIVIFLLIAAYSAFVIIKIVRSKKHGGACIGCSSGSCSSCSKCSSEHFDQLIREAKEKKETNG
ncbi:MAG: FeoB-associated Cys-rich membrane protein [Sphaerochaetaceae bacterium]